MSRIRSTSARGFTLIELLVVVLIIGILAAVAIPTFLNQRTRAWEASVQSDIRNAATAIESYAIGNNGSYEGSAAGSSVALADLQAEGFNPTENVTLTITSTPDVYSIEGCHTSGGDGFSFTTDQTDPNAGEVFRDAALSCGP